MIFARFSRTRISASMLCPEFCFHATPLPCYLRGCRARGMRTTFVLQQSTFKPRKLQASPRTTFYYKSRLPATEAPGVCGVLRLYYKSRLSTATEAPGVCGVLRLYYKSRLASHGSPRRTTSVLQKSTFQPRKLRVSAAYYVCTTQVDFPATEALGIRGVLRLYYKSRLSSY